MRRTAMSARTLRRAVIESLEGRTLLASSSLLYTGLDGNLVYSPDPQGNTIVDFSNVGYKGGTTALPTSLTIKITLTPNASGDDTSRIQAAINQVAAMPLGTDGFRGVVLLKAGEYRVSGSIGISASGIVLRGETNPTTGAPTTVIRATGTSTRNLLWIDGPGSRSQVSGTLHNLTDVYVPSGARSFHVDSTAGLVVGDTVIVHRPSTAEWIHDIGMDLLEFPWTPGSHDIDFDRVITRIEGNTITLDAPLANQFESKYGGGTIYKYTWSGGGRTQNVGIENIYGISDFAGTDPLTSTDEQHASNLASINDAQNAWVRNCVAQNFASGAVTVSGGAKWVTIQGVQNLDPVSPITGGERYSFLVKGQQVLVKNCYARRGRHDFVLIGSIAGPNAFVDCSDDNAFAEQGPHDGWAVGSLFDRLTLKGDPSVGSVGLKVRNAGNEGTAHGWQGANTVFWDNTVSGIQVYKPPTAQNYAIGNTVGAIKGDGFVELTNTAVTPTSLYAAQLADRTRYSAVSYRQYWLGDIDLFTAANAADAVPVNPTWLSTVKSFSSLPVEGFDAISASHLVPLTIDFPLAGGEQVVSATLSLSLRSGGTSSSGDRIYFDSTSNGYSLADLGLGAVAATGSTVRTIDLTRFMSLLEDGRLNLLLSGTLAVDWAKLDIKVAPQSKLTTTTTLKSSINPSASLQAVTLTATVAPGSSTTAVPGGTVTFLDGAKILGTGVLNSARQATLTISSLAGGSHAIRAAYAGDAKFVASTSTALTQIVAKAATSITLASSASPALAGQAVTFTATVSAAPGISGTPTGTLSFKDGSTLLGTASVNSSTGKATFTTSALTSGTHTITASYGGSSAFLTSTSASLSQVVSTRLDLILGDSDNFVNNGAIDAVYVDPTWQAAVAASTTQTLAGFDVLKSDRQIPFTFLYSVPADQQVIAATLTISLRAVSTATYVATDTLRLDSLSNKFSFTDLSWIPLSTSGSNVRTFDLSAQLALLQDGQLNVLIEDDSAVDFAKLTINTVPKTSPVPLAISSLAATTSLQASSTATRIPTDTPPLNNLNWIPLPIPSHAPTHTPPRDPSDPLSLLHDTQPNLLTLPERATRDSAGWEWAKQ